MIVKLFMEYIEKVVQILARKKRTRFQKITLVFVWIMIIATIGSLVISAIMTFI
ncbi:hypothetical protein HMPREF9104_00278 [Lentilactobacillus kisonensis F0435]|uniref:DUF4044 domain-containing protein n=1 Tax=Lentilactobacillus kisonensis F0435 TaxID=797516 RepID=H1LCG5_9LACO|nr:hypothetical protein HMPREF9104_00278 [Lentilactobacillus kisonensis F0435]